SSAPSTRLLTEEVTVLSAWTEGVAMDKTEESGKVARRIKARERVTVWPADERQRRRVCSPWRCRRVHPHRDPSPQTAYRRPSRHRSGAARSARCRHRGGAETSRAR